MALKTDDRTKSFYNIPMIRISYTGLLLTIIFGALCMAVPDLSNWAGVISCLPVLVFTAIAVIKANAAADIAENIDCRVRAEIFFIKSLTDDAKSLMARAKTAEARRSTVLQGNL